MSTAKPPRSPRTLLQRRFITALLLCISLLMAHKIALATATSTVVLSVPATAPIGADFSFSATFDNSGTTAYGPFIDIVFPATGADGNDGISFTDATYLGQPLTAVTLTFPAGGCVPHPYAQDTSHAPLQVCGTPGDTLVVLQLPFGSFTPAQPPARVTVNAHLSDLADLGTALTIRARSGFQYGNDALDNPCCDPSIVNPSSTSSATWPGNPLTPTLLTLTKTYIGPEDETATGPNYPRQYHIDVDIAPGQIVTNLQIQDLLPNSMQFVTVNSVSGGAVIATTDPSTTIPGGTLSRTLGSVTGTAATNDASVLFTFYVPLNNAAGSPVLNAASGDDALALNNASALGNWTPKDPRDPGGTSNAVANPPGPEHTLTAKSIAIQKSVAIVNDAGMAGYSVGDTLEYTLQFQVSDYFAFQSVVISDTISDGQHYDVAFQPMLSVNGNGFALGNGTMNATNVTVAPNYTPADPAPNDGTTTFSFRVSNELLSRGRPNGRWVGGCVPLAGSGGPALDCGTYNDGATSATLTFRTIIQDTFSDTFPSGDPYVDSGDHLDNAVTITGDLLSVANTNNPTGAAEADTSGTSVNIVFDNLSKSVYAINGSTSFATPVRVMAGDTVTYRIQYGLAASDFENLQLVDNLPLPIFSATQIAPPLSAAAVPPAGQVAYGPTDTYHTLSGVTPVTPTITTSATENSLTFGYGTFNDPANRSSVIDLLFTVTVSAQPFADKLFLTNQVHESDGSTNGPLHQTDAIVQIQLTEPVLRIKKGVIGSDHASATLTPTTTGPIGFSAPGSAGPRWAGTINSTNLANSPIDSNISGVDTGDLVSYAIIIENTGTSQKGAFDVTITDTLPSGLSIPLGGAGLNMRVTYGNGTPLTFAPLGPSNSASDLFANGITLDDPAGAGACQTYDPNNGKNIIVITYDLRVDPTAPAGLIIPNRASITNYAGDEGGPNFVPVDHPTDIANTTIAAPGLSKQLTGTEINNANNSSSQAVIGELVTYTIGISVPEGIISAAQIVDTLDAGLAFVDLVSVSSSPGVSMSTPIGVGASPANVTVSAGGGTITFNPGTISNSDTNNAQAETISIVYRAVVLNSAGNQDTPATLLNNAAALAWANGALPSVSAANVTVIEPILSTAKSVATTPAANADAGDPVRYTITLQHAGTSGTDAYDVTFNDPLPKIGASGPSYIDNPTIIVTDSAGLVSSANFTLIGSNAGGWTLATSAGGFDFAKLAARTLTITVNGTISRSAAPGVSIQNSATTQWTSLDNAPGARSTYNANATERTGVGGVNDYTSSGSATFTPALPLLTKAIIATSEPHTTNVGGIERLAIGEIVRYHLAVQLPEGTATDFQIHDFLPTGMIFVDDGSARVAFVSSSATGIISATYGSGAGLIPTVPCANTVGAAGAGTPACALGNVNISSSATSNNDSYTSGTDPFFKLGTLVNSDSDSDGEFVVVEFNALVDNSASGSNDAGDNRNNNFGAFGRDAGGTLVQIGATSNTINGRISEPFIPFDATTNNKTVTPNSGDAGDIVNYTVVYQNANGANNTDAFDVRIVDILPAALTLNVASVNVAFNAACVSPSFSNSSAGNSVDVTVSRVRPNCQVAITYQAALKLTVTPGQLITNTANLTYTSLPGANGTLGNPTGSNNSGTPSSGSGERDGSGGAINDYLGNDQAQVTVFVPTPQKSLVATSEAHTSASSLAIGEIARYRMAVQIAEGTSPNFQLRDNLPTGLRFLNDGTARIALVSSDPGLTSSLIAGAGLAVVGDETTVNAVTPSFLLPSSAISGGSGAGATFLEGDDPTFSLGDLGNTDSDGNQEFVVIEFNALAANSASTAGATLNNTFDVLINGTPLAASNIVGVSVVEPAIGTLTKQVTTTPSDAGDTVVYTLSYTNTASGAGRADAFDVALIDTLNSNLALQSVSVTAPVGSTATDSSTLGTGGVVRVIIDRLPPSADIAGAVKRVTITVTARVINSALNGQIIPNSASLTYSSLPGASGTPSNPTGSSTPGGSGANNGERNGAGGVNSYSTTSNIVNVTLATPTIAKLAPAPLSYPIGDVVTYDIRVTLPEGATPGLKVIDTLPAGMAYVSHSVVTTAAASNGHLPADYNGTLGAPTFTNSSGVLTFDFGTPQTNGSGPTNGSSNNQFLVRVVARVQNVLANQQGTTLTNSANLTYTNPNSGATVNLSGGSQAITVVEPVLALNKRILTPASPADAGGVVTYQITITNTTGTNISSAYDTRYRDILPAGLALNLPLTISGAGGAAGISDSSAGNVVDVTIATLPSGGSVTIQYAATLTSAVGPGQTINNTGDVTWSSLPGGDANERHDGDGNQGGGGLNDYELQSSASFTTANNPAISKALASTSDPQTPNADVTIGEVLVYTLALTLPEGTTPSLTVIDDLPPGLAYIAGSATVDSSGFGGSVPVPSVTSAGGSGDDITFSFGAISIAGDNDTTNNSFLLRLQAYTLDSAGNVGVNPPGQTSLPNSATLQIGSGPVVPANSVVATVVEPRISTTKSVNPASNVQAGSIVNYTVRFTNSGTSTAYDVTASDTLAPSTSFTALIGCVDQNGTTTAALATNNGATVDFSSAAGGFDISAGGFVECTYTATAQSSLLVEGSYTNMIDADWSSLDGNSSGERIYDDTISRPTDGTQDSDTASFTSAAPTFSKSDGGVTEATIGQHISYTLSITSPTGTLRELVITDTLPAGLIYDTGSYSVNGISTPPTFSASTPNDGSAPVVLEWDLGNAAISASPAQIVFSATVANVLGNQQGVTLTNSAVLGHANAAGVAQPLLPGSDSVVLVEPTLVIDKSVTPLSANVGDLVTFRMAITNTATVAAYDVVISDTVPAELTYAPGSIRVVSGPASTTNATGAPYLTWSFAAVPAGATAVAEFEARLNGSGTLGTPIVNSADVTWTSTPGGNPDERSGAGGGPNDYRDSSQATLATAAYQLSKTLIDPPSGMANVHDTVQFSITITNTGATPLTTVPLTDSFDPAFLQFLTASTPPDTTAAGLLTWNNVGPLKPNGTSTITVDFTAIAGTSGQPGGVTINRASVSAAKDSNNTTLAPQTSSAPVAIGAPDLRLSKSDGGSRLLPGALITYTLTYANMGPMPATGVVITETVPANTRFSMIGSLPNPWSCADGAPAGTICTAAISGVVAGNGGGGSLRFIAQIDDPLPSSVVQIVNTAVIGDDGASGADPTPANNAGSATTSINPTALTLRSFTTTPHGDHIRVAWETSAEINTWGFYLYRSADGSRAHAVQVTPEIILGRGRSQGASYSWDDTTAELGVRYTYWLQEVELNGHTNEYGPASVVRGPAGAQYRIFLPLIGR